MSVFSGKCDFYDSFCMISGDGDESKILENLPKLKLYIIGRDGRDHRLKSDTIKDIAKYYPYLTALEAGDRDGNHVVVLSSNSFIDQEESEMLKYKVDDVLKYWRKCKRTKKPFKEDECLERLWYIASNELKEIIHRVAENGNKAEFDDIHFPLWEHFRRNWFEELVRVGYTEQEAYNWCFNGFFDPVSVEEKRLGRPVKK